VFVEMVLAFAAWEPGGRSCLTITEPDSRLASLPGSRDPVAAGPMWLDGAVVPAGTGAQPVKA
jgi:hypothetical protein